MGLDYLIAGLGYLVLAAVLGIIAGKILAKING